MYKFAKMSLSWLLVVALLIPLLGVTSQAASVETIKDAELKEFYLKEFNTVVNAVKKDRPGVTVLATGEVKQNADAEGDRMADFAKMVVENVFKNEQSLAADLIDGLNYDDYAYLTQTAEVAYERGALNTVKVPVSGKDYVSGLTTKYNFTMKKLRNDSKQRTEILIQFPDCTLLEALDTKKTDMSKVFDLPTNTDVILTKNDEEATILEGGFFQLDDIVCTNAYVDIIYNDDLELISYTSNINYRVKVSTYTVLESLWPTFFKLMQSMGLNVGDVADFNIISIIMAIIGGATGFDPEDSMNSVYTDYNITYQMYELDWTPRYFGDVNRDNRVDANDARAILRTTAGFGDVKKDGDLFFADMTFDGKVTADDARLALRVAVGLEKKFTSYEMRQQQINGNWEDPDMPDNPVAPPVIPDEPEVPEIPID